MLNAGAIIAEAEQRVGIDDSDAAVRANLERLVASLNVAGLSAQGVERTRGQFLADSVNRLEGLKWLRDHPEIGSEPVRGPLFLTGLPRSGTTYLQYLFDRDPRYRQIRTWQAMMPHPPPGLEPSSVAGRQAAWAQSRKARPAVPGFEALHLYDDDGPEECHAFLEQSFGAAGLHNLFSVPDYFDYLLDELDLVESYRIHRRQLQLLQWRLDPRPWALKYPNHVIAMDAILAVYPDARFVMTHRDPVQTLASISNLTFKLRGARTERPVDPHQVGSEMRHFVRRHIERILEFDRSPHRDRVIHVDYYTLVADPVPEMRRIHAALGLGTPDELADSLADWHRTNPKNARGRNDYGIAQWGLDEVEMAELYGDYMERFALPRERDGLRGQR